MSETIGSIPLPPFKNGEKVKLRRQTAEYPAESRGRVSAIHRQGSGWIISVEMEDGDWIHRLEPGEIEPA